VSPVVETVLHCHRAPFQNGDDSREALVHAMETNRRTFLRSVAASMAASAAKPVVRADEEDVYENDALRMRIVKPSGWEYADRVEWSLFWEGVRYQSGELGQDELKALMTQPLVVMSREDPRTPIRASVSVYPDPDVPPEDSLAEAHARYVRVLSRIWLDFELLEPPEPASLGTLPASRLRGRLTAEHATEGNHTGDVEHYLLNRYGLVIGFTFARAPKGCTDSIVSELESIRESVEFLA
jgi:hypothetical protein